MLSCNYHVIIQEGNIFNSNWCNIVLQKRIHLAWNKQQTSWGRGNAPFVMSQKAGFALVSGSLVTIYLFCFLGGSSCLEHGQNFSPGTQVEKVLSRPSNHSPTHFPRCPRGGGGGCSMLPDWPVSFIPLLASSSATGANDTSAQPAGPHKSSRGWGVGGRGDQ